MSVINLSPCAGFMYLSPLLDCELPEDRAYVLFFLTSSHLTECLMVGVQYVFTDRKQNKQARSHERKEGKRLIETNVARDLWPVIN